MRGSTCWAARSAPHRMRRSDRTWPLADRWRHVQMALHPPATITTTDAARYPNKPMPHLVEYGQNMIPTPNAMASSSRAMTPSVEVVRAGAAGALGAGAALPGLAGLPP